VFVRRGRGTRLPGHRGGNKLDHRTNVTDFDAIVIGFDSDGHQVQKFWFVESLSSLSLLRLQNIARHEAWHDFIWTDKSRLILIWRLRMGQTNSKSIA